MKPELLDELILIGADGQRSLDCVIIVKLKDSFSIDNLKAGADRAQSLFPKTARFPVKISSDKEQDIFVNSPLESHFHIELAIFRNHSLGLKMSHYLGDAVSMLLWLKAVFGKEVSIAPLKLRTFPAKKDSPYRKIFNSEVWPRPLSQLSFKREVRRFVISHSDIPEGLSLNDIFILSLLDSLKLSRKAIWIPVNVRETFFEGFGNGLSRLRVYPPSGHSTPDRILHIRKQKKESQSNGEVSLPPEELELGSPLKKTLFKAWVNRPWADWGSLSLSHISDINHDFEEFEEILGISNIMPRHHGALFTFTRKNTSYFTLTYDSASVTTQDVEELIASFTTRTGEIIHDLLL